MRLLQYCINKKAIGERVSRFIHVSSPFPFSILYRRASTSWCITSAIGPLELITRETIQSLQLFREIRGIFGSDANHLEWSVGTIKLLVLTKKYDPDNKYRSNASTSMPPNGIVGKSRFCMLRTIEAYLVLDGIRFTWRLFVYTRTHTHAHIRPTHAHIRSLSLVLCCSM